MSTLKKTVMSCYGQDPSLPPSMHSNSTCSCPTNHTPTISESFWKTLGEVTEVIVFLPDNRKKGIFLIDD